MKAYFDKDSLSRLGEEREGAVPVIFFDRDGVINRRMPPHQHVITKEEFEILPNTYEAIRIVNNRHIPTILITNQRSISIGTLTDEGFRDINNHMINVFKTHGVYLDGVFYCPHSDSDGCNCRKPKIGLFIEAELEFKSLGLDIDKTSSWMIGDEYYDIEAGRNYGVNTVYVGNHFQTVKNCTAPNNQKSIIAGDILEAIELIMEEINIV